MFDLVGLVRKITTIDYVTIGSWLCWLQERQKGGIDDYIFSSATAWLRDGNFLDFFGVRSTVQYQ